MDNNYRGQNEQPGYNGSPWAGQGTAPYPQGNPVQGSASSAPYPQQGMPYQQPWQQQGGNPYPSNGYPPPGQPPYQQGYYQQPVVVNQLENKKDGLAITSLVLGILGIVFCWCLAIPIIICIIGLIMGIMSLVKTGQHSGIALGGVITSAIGLVLSFALLLLFIV